MANGVFISLDGMDGVGKSTQCRLLAEWVRTNGLDVVVCHDPGGTTLGQQLRDLLLHYRGAMSISAEALLFMASRAQLVVEVIRPALASGKVVICDRFLLANVVYQGHAGGIDPAQLWEIGRFSTGDTMPDRTIVLDLPLDVSLARRKAGPDRMESRGEEYFGKVRSGFLWEASRDPHHIRIVDATMDVGAVQTAIRRETAALFHFPYSE